MEKYKEGIRWIGHRMDKNIYGCIKIIVATIFILALLVMFAACNNGGKIDPGVKPSPVPVPIDTIKTPDGKDSVIYEPLSAFATVQEAVNKISYVIGNTAPVEMKEGDNYEVLQAVINKKYGAYQIPNGRFKVSKTLKFVDSEIILIGSGNTTLDFDPGTDGVEITSGGPTLARLKFSSAPVGSATGIKVHAITRLIQVHVHGFGGKGISVTADIEHGSGNASHSQILFCQASENGDDGLHFQGGDVNACGVIGFDSRDNKGWGINDDSFLGNTFINTMCHSNAKGHYRAENGNNRTVFISPYAEEDSPPSRLGGVTRVFGGLIGYEVTPDLKFYKGTTTAYRGTGGYVITSPHAQVNTQ